MRTTTTKLFLFGLSALILALVVARHSPRAQGSPPSPPPSDPKTGGWDCRPNGDHRFCKWEY